MKTNKHINCLACSRPHECCQIGSWVDLDEAKKILALKIKGGNFYLLRKVKHRDFPSGYMTSTSYGMTPCTFLNKAGRCIIHIKDYRLKPVVCKEFPFEDGKLSKEVHSICAEIKKRK